MVMPGPAPDSKPALLSVCGLRIASHEVTAVRAAWLEVSRGRIAAVVGESGSGKSMLAFALMGLLPLGFAACAGRATLTTPDGALELAEMKGRAWRGVRGSRIAMVFQEPMTSLNPVLTVGEQVLEAVTGGDSRLRRRALALEAMAGAGLADASKLMASFPHELSGGMRQRVMIAIALACRPMLLIADEPTTALDVTVQAEVLRTIRGLAVERGLGVLLITHDLGLVGKYADTVMVMREGMTLESGAAADVLGSPRHVYTRALLAARPQLHARRDLLSAREPGDGEAGPQMETATGDEDRLVEVAPGHHVLVGQPAAGGVS